MLGNSTKVALVKILQSLEAGDPSVWDDQNESGKYCLLELHQMSGPGYRGSRAEPGSNPEPAREKLKTRDTARQFHVEGDSAEGSGRGARMREAGLGGNVSSVNRINKCKC